MAVHWKIIHLLYLQFFLTCSPKPIHAVEISQIEGYFYRPSAQTSDGTLQHVARIKSDSEHESVCFFGPVYYRFIFFH